ncbi:MAG TPA: hypothetical protein VF250_04245, partial [Conexibacter sp.]
MGLLDDAIREHLDLKRRRGADPSEVARLEHEALGPVRREPAPTEPAAASGAAEQPREQPATEEAPAPADHPHPASEDTHPDDHTHVLAPEDRREPPHGDPLFEETGLGGAAEQGPEAGDADRAGGAGETISAAPPAESSSPATGPARRTADPELVDQPTTEYRVEDDVLEETPEFLQETPEHDRLWFEQRPPR